VTDCRNDCLDPVRFPARPENRPALPRIGYRIGSYADIREFLLRNLDKTPSLSAWTHRGADDPGIALLEGASILGDILTFYQELYANEAYLRTARWRESISDLVRLLGYRLSPGLGGRATFAFTFKGDKSVTIPEGFPLKADVTGLEQPADFETGAAATAYPWLGNFNLFRPLTSPNVTASTVEFYIQSPNQFAPGAAVELKAGDRLLVGVGNPAASPKLIDSHEIVVVDSVRELLGVKVVKIKGKLKWKGNDAPQFSAYKLGRSFHHFGHNGPVTKIETPDKITSTATLSNDGKTSTVESTPPKEVPLSFYRGIVGDTASDAAVRAAFLALAKALAKAFGLGSNIGINPNLGFSAQALASVPDGTPVLIVEPVLRKTEFPLDAEVQDLPAGVTLVVEATLYKTNGGGEGKEFAFAREVASVRSAPFTWGLSSGTTSVVTLAEGLDTSSGDYHYMEIRQALFHETVSPLLTLRPVMAPAAPADKNVLNFRGTAAQAQDLKGRRLIFARTDGTTFEATVAEVADASANDGSHPLLHKITLTPKDAPDINYADFPLEPPYPYTVYGNVVDATQGKTEKEAPLGNGDSRLVFQTFKIPKAPVTYLLSESESPPEAPELEIWVGGRRWQRVNSFFGRAPLEQIYIVREDAENVSWVQFGDGKTGARLPSGVRNVVAKYRTGTGAYGPLKAGAKPAAGGKLDGIDKVQMPGPAACGSSPEDGENAREAAPGKTLSLDRLVSLQDFESETLAISGVSRASAAWRLVGNIPTLVVTVLMETGRAAEHTAVADLLNRYNGGEYGVSRGAGRFPVLTVEGHRQFVALSATFGYDPTYDVNALKAAITKALGADDAVSGGADEREGLFALLRRRFGQREYATSVAGTIQQVEGVVWAQVTRLVPVGTADDPAAISPAAAPQVVNETVACAPEHILSLYGGHLVLAGVAEKPQGVG
jgi:hypothetical protein